VVILEPFQSGYIPTSFEFMCRLRDITKELGMVLVFDEVKTGFRIRLGGAQEYYGIQPDLTTLGKVLGGGFPVGAVGGKKEILELASPARSRIASEIVFHSGTFNGNPVSLLAGLRTIEFLQEAGNYDALLKTTKALRYNMEAISQDYGLLMRTVGEGTIFNLIFPAGDSFDATKYSDDELFDIVSAEQSSRHRQLRGKLDFLMMKHGVFSKPYNRFSMSLVHDETAISHTLDAFERSVFELKNSFVVR
jgi:glutamate-1-semialdehyde 2,1-aminomutase